MTAPGSQQPASLLSIREIAHLTGVSPATLRAWERRYGLLQPQRTSKGHRLYSDEHIARILQVLVRLEQGVAISQVKRRLQDPQHVLVQDYSQWDEQRQQWLSHIEQLNERALDGCFNQAQAHYPSETLCQHLLWPILEQLRLRWNSQPGTRAEQVFFLSWLRSKLGARVYHGNRLLDGPPLLMLNLSDQVMEPGLWLCAWLASNRGRPVRVLDWSMPATELSQAIRRIGPCAVLLYGNQMLATGYLQQLFNAVDCPQLLCGHAVSIHHAELVDLPDLHLAEDPLAAMQRLHCLDLLDHR